MELKNAITGIILAGGKSSRMGHDKALVNFNDKKLIEYAIELMKSLAREIIISANDNKYAEYGFPVVADNFPGLGPISGLEAALKHSKTLNNIIIPCDTPFVSAELYHSLLSYSEKYDAVVPLSATGKVEPLAAFYSKNILPAIEQQITTGDYKLQNLLQKINTKYVQTDNTHNFNNINTVTDLQNSIKQVKR